MSAVAAVVIVVALLGVLALTVAAASVQILREYERAVVFRLGRLVGEKGPGLVVRSLPSTGWCAWTCARSRSTSRRRASSRATTSRRR